MRGFNDIETTNPEEIKDWDYEQNDLLGIRPCDCTGGSAKKVWWKCDRCGGSYPQSIHEHVKRGGGCPYCHGNKVLPGVSDLRTRAPQLIEDEWDFQKNLAEGLKPEELTYSSGVKAWWRCPKCGNSWQATVNNRTYGFGCPRCASSSGEKDSASWAVSQGFVIAEQWRDPECRDKRSLPFDLMLYAPLGSFVRAPLMAVALVEYDGEHHSDPNTYFNMKNLTRGGFDYVQRHDAIKDAYCEATGRLLIRVPYTITGVEDIGAYIEAVLRKDGFGWWFDERPESPDNAA